MEFNRKQLAAAVLIAAIAISSAALAKEKPEVICKNRMLTYKQRYLCQQQLDNVQSKSDQKAVVQRFSDLIRAAEKAQAEQK